MSIVQTQTTSFKAELYQGIHDLTTDVIKIALYNGSANLNEDTTVYTTSNEIVASGYTAGGKTMTGITVNISGYTAYNKSVAVLDFGSDKTTTSTFTITMPANTASAALIRSSI